MSDFRETLYTVDARGHRKWVYPTVVEGFFRKRRTIVAVILLFIYLSMPWIPVHGMQAIHLDLAHRRFVFFGATFWATDTKFLFFILATLGFSLFFFTALLGRVWCGWACPETVFLEFLFRPIEKLIEGGPTQRKKLDDGPWNLHKIRVKFTKYFVFSIFAWIIASTALAYFIGREPLLAMMADYPWNHPQPFILTLALMGAMLFQFGWFREQFCTVVCPYARFQSVLLDDSSLLVGYDISRGEPRGKVSEKTGGDCVDCGLCVKVCPTGIDIRNGLQLECVQCAACADACDSVMVKIGRPTKLIRYDTERGLKGEKTRFLRPRVAVYGTVLVTIITLLLYSLETRAPFEASIFHSPTDKVYTTAENKEIINHLEIHIENKLSLDDAFSISVKDQSRISLVIPLQPFPVSAMSYQSVPVFAHFPADILDHGKLPIAILVTSKNGVQKQLNVNLLGPG